MLSYRVLIFHVVIHSLFCQICQIKEQKLHGFIQFVHVVNICLKTWPNLFRFDTMLNTYLFLVCLFLSWLQATVQQDVQYCTKDLTRLFSRMRFWMLVAHVHFCTTVQYLIWFYWVMLNMFKAGRRLQTGRYVNHQLTEKPRLSSF